MNHSNIATTLSYIEVDYDHMRSVLHERSLIQGAFTFEKRVDEHIPIETDQPSPAPPMLALPENIDPEPASTIEQTVAEDYEKSASPSLESKLLTHVPSLASERFTLEQALLPAGTGLSHELTWDGPGTWWEELGLPPAEPVDEASEHSLLLTLMASRIGTKSYSW